MKRKYSVHQDFSCMAWFTSPFTKFIFPLASWFLGFFSVKSDKQITVKKQKIQSKDGSFFKTLLIEPKGCENNLPCMVYMAGGGFAFKPAPSHYRLIKEYSLKVNCKVLLTYYRLAPKYKFPLAVEDCYSAYEWVVNNAEELGIEKNRIAVGGDSAGGNLATACALTARDNGLQMPCFQMLVYPVVDAEMRTESMKNYVDTPVWNAKLNQRMWTYYLASEQDRNNPYASLMRAKSFSEMPTTYLEVAEFDPLRDEGVIYAKALEKDGVSVTFYETKGTIHGFDFISKSEIVEKAVEERVRFMRENFELN